MAKDLGVFGRGLWKVVSMDSPPPSKNPKFPIDKPMSIEQRWNVPPDNSVHVCLSQQSNGMFYVSLEDYLDDGVWKFREGSTGGRGFSNQDEAFARAEELWYEEQKRSGGRSRFDGKAGFRANDIASQE